LYSPSKIAFKYLNFLFRAANGKGHGVHSPFVYNFIREILRYVPDKKEKELFSKLENRRRELKRDHSFIPVSDLGAGSEKLKTRQRRVSSIASTSLKSPKYARLLYRMATYYQALRILELGTSLGVTSTYLASANPDSELFTFEGIPGIAEKAKESFLKSGLKNVTLHLGNFDSTLPAFVTGLNKPLDLLFIDGNHRMEPTLHYFNLLLSASHKHSIFIFDDIHWSAEMESAWDQLKSHPAVTGSIDLFFMGIILVSPDFKEPVHIKIRY